MLEIAGKGLTLLGLFRLFENWWELRAGDSQFAKTVAEALRGLPRGAAHAVAGAEGGREAARGAAGGGDVAEDFPAPHRPRHGFDDALAVHDPAQDRRGVLRAPVPGLVERFDIEPSSDFSAK